MKINELPSYAKDYEWIVFSIDSNDEWWFYGAYNGMDKAKEVAVWGGMYFTRTANLD